MILAYLFNPRNCQKSSSSFLQSISKIDYVKVTDDYNNSEAVVINFEDIDTFTKSFGDKPAKLRCISIAGPASNDAIKNLSCIFNVPIFTTPGQAISSVAERNLLLTLAVSQYLPCQMLSKNMVHWKSIYCTELNGKTMGFWGFGKIAKYLSPIYIALGMDVIVCTSQDLNENDKINKVHEADLIQRSDILNIQLRLTKETLGILDKEKISRMKTGSILINTSRSDLVDCDALYEALIGNQIAGAGFDVYEREPLPIEHPLFEMNNVVMTPHSAWKTEETMNRFFDQSFENIKTGICYAK